MSRTVTNYQKHGYFHGIDKDASPEHAMRIFCMRRSGDIIKEFGHSLPYNDLIAKVYYQGLYDGMSLNEKK